MPRALTQITLSDTYSPAMTQPIWHTDQSIPLTDELSRQTDYLISYVRQLGPLPMLFLHCTLVYQLSLASLYRYHVTLYRCHVTARRVSDWSVLHSLWADIGRAYRGAVGVYGCVVPFSFLTCNLYFLDSIFHFPFLFYSTSAPVICSYCSCFGADVIIIEYTAAAPNIATHRRQAINTTAATLISPDYSTALTDSRHALRAIFINPCPKYYGF